MDLRFRTPFRLIISGPSQCGKSTFVRNLLADRYSLFDCPTDCVFYFYSTWQEIFDQFNNDNLVTSFINHMPTEEEIVQLCANRKNGSVVILDDLIFQLNSVVAKLFISLSHAHNINVILLTQNLFLATPIYRTISINTTYLIVFRNPRDASIISSLAKQVAPGNTKFVIESFKDATKRPYSYLMFDFHQATPEILKLRTNILQNEFPIKVYTQTDCNGNVI
jgi:hypothetical protein